MKRHSAFISILLLLILSLFSSCASTRAVEPVYMTDDKAITLLELSSVGEPLDCYQFMTGSFEDHDDFSAEVLLKADSSILALIVMTPTGQTIAEITYDGDVVHFESPFIPANAFKAEYILADIQLAFYEVHAVEKKIESSGLEFRFIDDENGVSREILDGHDVIWRATAYGSHVSVVNNLRKYNYEIEILI